MVDKTARGDSVFSDVNGILNPRSVAVVGASDRPGNFGGDTVRRLLKYPFPGPVWPVNPNYETVVGLKCYPNAAALPGVADLAVITTSSAAVLDTVRDFAAAGTRHAVVYAGGFAEAGGEGVELQRKLVDLCSETGFKLCGPNCVGVINAHMPMTGTFATALEQVDRLTPGDISIISQSGGMSTSAMALILKAGFGIRYLISSGNEANVSFSDYLYALAQDEGTRIIAGYLEGATDGRKLLLALQEARKRRKPVVLIKAGTTGASASAAAAHTGALSGEDRVYEAIFREMAAIRVYSLEELVDVVLLLSSTENAKLPKGRAVGVITFGGGNGVLAADQCAQNGLTTPRLQPQTVEQLKQLLMSVATAANPTDLTPTTAFRPEYMARLPRALDVVAAQPDIDSMVIIAGSMAARAREISDVMTDFWKRANKPVCLTWPDTPKGVFELLAERGVCCFAEQGRGVRALGRIVKFGAELSRPVHPSEIELPKFDWSAHVPSPAPGTVVSEHQCHRMLAAAGLAVAAGKLANSESEAVEAAEKVGLPIALKAVSPSVTHRAKAGLLAVDLRTLDEVRAGYRRLTGRARELKAELEGIYVQHMVSGGTELLVSAFRDPSFGPILTVGAGGNLTEVLDDVVLERAPVDEAVALDLLGRLRMMRKASSDLENNGKAVARFVAEFSRLAATAPWERFVLEVNPIKWSGDDVVAVDGLLIIEKP